MSPPREMSEDQVLLAMWTTLQGRVLNARARHDDLAERHRLMVAMNYRASADVLRQKVNAAHADIEKRQAAVTEFLARHPHLTKRGENT